MVIYVFIRSTTLSIQNSLVIKSVILFSIFQYVPIMCKHKSGCSRSGQHTAASSCASEAEAANKGAIAMTTAGECQLAGRGEEGPSQDKHSICITTPVPVHQLYTATATARQSQELGDDFIFNESSPMLAADNNQLSGHSSICAPCALPGCKKVAYSECGEESGLLQDTATGVIQGSVVEANASRKHSRWRSGVVVYPSVGSLTTEWKDDVSQFNSLTNLGTDLLPGSLGEPLQSDHSWYVKDCLVYNVDVRFVYNFISLQNLFVII